MELRCLDIFVHRMTQAAIEGVRKKNSKRNGPEYFFSSRKTKVFPESLPQIQPEFARILPGYCPNFARISPNLARIRYIGKMGEGRHIAPAPPPRLISLWCPLQKKKKNSDGPIDQPIGIGVN